MFHACLVSNLLCFVYTLRCFYMFSGTNLLIRCHSSSCLFSSVFGSRKAENQYSRNWMGQSQSQYFTEENTESRGETEGSHRAAAPPRRGPTLGRAWVGCGPPWPPSCLSSSPIRSPRCLNPKYLINIPRNRLQPPPPSSL